MPKVDSWWNRDRHRHKAGAGGACACFSTSKKEKQQLCGVCSPLLGALAWKLVQECQTDNERFIMMLKFLQPEVSTDISCIPSFWGLKSLVFARVTYRCGVKENKITFLNIIDGCGVRKVKSPFKTFLLLFLISKAHFGQNLQMNAQWLYTSDDQLKALSWAWITQTVCADTYEGSAVIAHTAMLSYSYMTCSAQTRSK